MPNNTPELLTALGILGKDSAIEPVGGRVLTKGVMNSGAVPGFTPSEILGRGGGKEGGIPLGNPTASGDPNDTSAWDDQAFLSRVVAEAIDAKNSSGGSGFPEMAEVGEGVLIYLLNRYSGYDEFLADPMIHTMPRRYKLDATYPTPLTPSATNDKGEVIPGQATPALTDDIIQNNRKSTYLYKFIECVFNNIKNNPYVFEVGMNASGEVVENLVVEKDFLSCVDLIPTCLECIQTVLDVRGDSSGAPTPCEGKISKVSSDPSETGAYINLLIQAPVEAIQKVIDHLEDEDNDSRISKVPNPCIFGKSEGCSPLQPYLDRHLQKDIAHKLSEEGLLERYFQEAMCPKIQDGYWVMPLRPFFMSPNDDPFSKSLPAAGKKWFDALPDDELPGFKEFEPAMGDGGVTQSSNKAKPASVAAKFDPNTKDNLRAIFMEISEALGEDLDRDVIPPLQTGSSQLLSLSMPSPIVPWVEITELERVTFEKSPVTRVMGPHMAHAILEWAVDQIPKIDLRILGLPVVVGPPPYLGLMGNISPPPSFPKEPPFGHPMSELSPGVELTTVIPEMTNVPEPPDIPEVPEIPSIPNMPPMPGMSMPAGGFSIPGMTTPSESPPLPKMTSTSDTPKIIIPGMTGVSD